MILRSRMAGARGFTLIEMMIVVVILAILVGFAIPSFREAFATQRVKTAAKTMYTALRQARSEAIRMNGLCDVYIIPADQGDWATELHIVGVTVGGAVPAFDSTPPVTYAACQFDGNGDGDFSDAGIDITYQNPLGVFSEQQSVNGTPDNAGNTLANIRYNLLGRPVGGTVDPVDFCDDDGLAPLEWTITLDAAGLPQYATGAACP